MIGLYKNTVKNFSANLGAVGTLTKVAVPPPRLCGFLRCHTRVRPVSKSVNTRRKSLVCNDVYLQMVELPSVWETQTIHAGKTKSQFGGRGSRRILQMASVKRCQNPGCFEQESSRVAEIYLLPAWN